MAPEPSLGQEGTAAVREGGGGTLPARNQGRWSALPKLWEGQTLQEKAAKETIDPSASW